MIAGILLTLDPDYPAAIVPATGGEIDEPAARYEGKAKPDFVAADDIGWGPNAS